MRLLAGTGTAHVDATMSDAAEAPTKAGFLAAIAIRPPPVAGALGRVKDLASSRNTIVNVPRAPEGEPSEKEERSRNKLRQRNPEVPHQGGT